MPVNGVSQLRRPRPVRRAGVRLDCNRACRCAVVGVLFRADYRARPQGHRLSSRQQRQQEHRRAGDLGIRPPPRPSGTAAWPSAGRSASPSASQRPPERLPNPRVYSRVPPPPAIRKVPVNGVSQLRRPRPVRRAGVRLDCNRACRRAVVGVLFRADYRARPQGHRSSSRQQRQQEHRRAGDLGIRPPPRPSGTAAWPSAGRSASPSAPQRPPERLPNPRVYSRVPPEIRKGARQRRFLSVADATRFATPESLPRTTIRHRRSVGASWHPPALHGLAYTETPPPAMQVPPPALETGHPGKIPAATPRPLRTPFERFEPTVRLIQKSHPAILAVTGRTTPPVAFYFRNGWLFSPEYAARPRGAPRTGGCPKGSGRAADTRRHARTARSDSACRGQE